MPWSGERLRVLVDGPVIEIASTRGLLGGPISPASMWQPVAGECTAWAIDKS